MLKEQSNSTPQVAALFIQGLALLMPTSWL
jgi:hypothetical protein